MPNLGQVVAGANLMSFVFALPVFKVTSPLCELGTHVPFTIVIRGFLFK